MMRSSSSSSFLAVSTPPEPLTLLTNLDKNTCIQDRNNEQRQIKGKETGHNHKYGCIKKNTVIS